MRGLGPRWGGFMSAARLKRMAKKNANDAAGWAKKPIIMAMRGSAEYKAWLERLAEFDRSSVAEMTERSHARYAREIGFEEPPPKR